MLYNVVVYRKLSDIYIYIYIFIGVYVLRVPTASRACSGSLALPEPSLGNISINEHLQKRILIIVCPSKRTRILPIMHLDVNAESCRSVLPPTTPLHRWLALALALITPLLQAILEPPPVCNYALFGFVIVNSDDAYDTRLIHRMIWSVHDPWHALSVLAAPSVRVSRYHACMVAKHHLAYVPTRTLGNSAIPQQ